MSFAQPAMAVLSAFQTIGQIQNARYQAALVERQAEEADQRAEFKARELELQLKQERLAIAGKEVQKLKDMNQIAAHNIAVGHASGVFHQGNTFMNETIKAGVEDIKILRTGLDIYAAKIRSQRANILRL